jgi:transposase
VSHTRPVYPPEFKAEAVQLVRRSDKSLGVLAKDLGVADQTLRTWVRQAEVDRGRRPGVTTAEQQRITALERQVKELQRANDILKAAASFFARELDPRLPK